MRYAFYLSMVLVMSALAGCGFMPKRMSVSDLRVVPMIQAAESFDRAAYGFTPIPTNGLVYLESRATKNYDTMLHFYGETSRTIAFRKTASGYRWIAEQETFTGPNLYTNVDGVFHEEITLTYDIESVSGYPTNKLHVEYWGDDARLATNSYDLRLAQVRPILAEWRQTLKKP